MKHNIKIFTIAIAGLLLFTGCKKFLNVNTDPDTTQDPSPSSVLPAMISGIPRGVQYDARYLSKYIQNLSASANGNADTWDRHGYVANSDAAGDIWRQAYFGLGGNLNYIIQKGLNMKNYGYVGVGLALKALMFQMATDYHGDIIYTEAFKDDTYYFKYDEQPTVYRGVDSLCKDAIHYFDLAIENKSVITGDLSYSGDLAKWKKVVYGILAKNFHRYSRKSSGYLPDSVIYYANLSMATVEDDFVVPFDATKNDDTNFYGTYRNNLTSFRQNNIIVKLLDGTTFTGSTERPNRDPRLRHMLTASQDTTNGNGGYRGVEAGIGDPYSALTGVYAVGTANWVNARKRVSAVWGDSIYANPSASAFSTQYGKYLFKDKAVMPVMSYTEIQFIKAEAAYLKQDFNTAYTAYIAGINGHFDFINRNYGSIRGNSNIFHTSALTAAERSSYLASQNVKQNANTITLRDIMLQKYIALWAWGWVETWVDLRRYHYNVDLDPTSRNDGEPVYRNYLMPSAFFANNQGKPVHRVRPRYNSEYVWNMEELKRIGADKADYHTIECWFSIP